MTAVTDNREIARLMVEDPRYVAAKAAFDAFMASPAGRLVNVALTGPNYRVKVAKVDPESLKRYDAHSYNWTWTNARIVDELRGEA